MRYFVYGSVSQLPEAGQTSGRTAALIPAEEIFALYVLCMRMAHYSLATSKRPCWAAAMGKECRPNNKTWRHSRKERGRPGDACWLEALGAAISPAEANAKKTLLHQLEAVGLLVLQGSRCFFARGRP